MSNRSSLIKSINKIGGRNAIKLPIRKSENMAQVESDWKVHWMNQYAQSQQEANEKIQRLQLETNNKIAEQKKK